MCQNKYKYPILIGLVAIFFLMEITVSIYANSLALQTDALHMLSDLLALIIGFSAIRLTQKQKTERYTYGWLRAEIIGGLINSVFLIAICFSLFLEIIQKFIELARNSAETKHLEQNIDVVLIAAGAGLIINIIGLILFSKEHHHSHGHGHEHNHTNTENPENPIHPLSLDVIVQTETTNYNDLAVLLHIIGDTLGSIVVIISALLIKYIDHPAKFYADPIASLLIVLFIGLSSFKLLKKTSFILLHRNHDIDYRELIDKIKAFTEISDVHEFHVWPLTNKINIASFHLKLRPLNGIPQRPLDTLLSEIKALLHQYGIHSSTIQPEFTPDTCIEPQCHQNCNTLQCCAMPS